MQSVESFPQAVVLGGPNGAGKTTSSRLLLPSGLRFLNGDVIAAELVAAGHSLAGVDVAAGRLLLDHVRQTVEARQSFGLETTLAARNIVRWIGEWQQAGYWVRLVFIALHTPEMAVRRVAGRVVDGGHDVPEDTIRRRWAAGLRALFDGCVPVVDAWVVIDNSHDAGRPVAAGTRNDPVPVVIDRWRWERLVDAAVRVGSVRAAWYGR